MKSHLLKYIAVYCSYLVHPSFILENIIIYVFYIEIMTFIWSITVNSFSSL